MKKRFIKSVALFVLIFSSTFSKLELTKEEKDLSIRNIKAKNGIVTSAHPLASKVGIEILKKGGNAIDAAVGVSFTLGLVEPNASGLGGGGYMLVNKDKKQKVYNYYEKVPKNLDYNNWKNIMKTKSYLTDGTGALIPGAVAGWLYALEKEGTMSIEEILEPVIELAEEGFEITPNMANVMADSYEILSSNEEIEKTFLNEGLPYGEGELFKNKNYANTLKLISKNGRDGFYKGEIASALTKANPLITQRDLDDYKPLVVEPISSEYRGYKIVTTPPETSGVTVIEMLNMMENFDVEELGKENPKLSHLWAETMNLAQKDRATYVGDPRFEDIPTNVLISQKYADIRVGAINKKKASGKVSEGYIKKNINQGKTEYECPSTTHVSIVDKYGNSVSMTNTIGYYFGYGIMVENSGFVLNNHVANFSYKEKNEMNMIEPGKRARTTMSPTMVFDKEGKLELIVGCPGADRIVSTIPLVISNYIDHKMDIQKAVDSPRIHKNNGKLYIEGSENEEAIKYLKKLGHDLQVKKSNDIFFGGVHAISIEENQYEGAADPRRDGKALGY